MTWNEMPTAYKFSVLLIVMAIGTIIGSGDWIIAGILLGIALVVYVIYSLTKKSNSESSNTKL